MPVSAVVPGLLMLGDDLAEALLELRPEAESRMVDTCTVQRPGETTPDPLTGADVTAYTPVYSGRCELKAANLQAHEAESATSQVTVQTFTLKVPNAAPALLPGDLVTFAADTFTPRLRNMKARVDGVHVGSFTTAQRVPVTVLPGVK